METAIIIGGSRLSTEKEAALCELVRRAATIGGIELFRLAWAADGMKGLRKRHTVSCPKIHPEDWQCECPSENPLDVPLCFHENQMSYHMLAWQPPDQLDPALEKELGEDLSRGTWSCLFHFIDAEGKPVDPTASLCEEIIPSLMVTREVDLAARHGYNAVRERERAKKRELLLEKQARQEKEFMDKAVRYLTEETVYVSHDGNVKPIDSRESLIVTP